MDSRPIEDCLPFCLGTNLPSETTYVRRSDTATNTLLFGIAITQATQLQVGQIYTIEWRTGVTGSITDTANLKVGLHHPQPEDEDPCFNVDCLLGDLLLADCSINSEPFAIRLPDISISGNDIPLTRCTVPPPPQEPGFFLWLVNIIRGFFDQNQTIH